MVRVQRIIVPDTQERCLVLFNSNQPLIAPNQYLSYLHHLGRSPNTVRAYAHHLQAFSKFLCEENRDWTTLSLTELAKFVAWLRRVSSSNGKARSDTTINTILAAVGSFYEYQDRLGDRHQVQSPKHNLRPRIHRACRFQNRFDPRVRAPVHQQQSIRSFDRERQFRQLQRPFLLRNCRHQENSRQYFRQLIYQHKIPRVIQLARCEVFRLGSREIPCRWGCSSPGAKLCPNCAHQNVTLQF
jgi:hypothetical protein